MKLEYKPIAIQDECFGGTKDQPNIYVIIKLFAQGKKSKYYKNDVLEFSSKEELDKYIKKNRLKIIKEVDFKANIGIQTQAIIKASNQK